MWAELLIAATITEKILCTIVVAFFVLAVWHEWIQAKEKRNGEE
jgi:hypothetical protein